MILTSDLNTQIVLFLSIQTHIHTILLIVRLEVERFNKFDTNKELIEDNVNQVKYTKKTSLKHNQSICFDYRNIRLTAWVLSAH